MVDAGLAAFESVHLRTAKVCCLVAVSMEWHCSAKFGYVQLGTLRIFLFFFSNFSSG